MTKPAGIIMKTAILRFLKSETGATAIEYAVVACAIGVACVAAMGLAGTSLNAKFTSVSSALN
jgi:pilus assembly protein Flp/PilA